MVYTWKLTVAIEITGMGCVELDRQMANPEVNKGAKGRRS
jgi:hypothetical protein